MAVATDHPTTSFALGAAPVRIGRARLKVRDLRRVSSFCRTALGLAPTGKAAGRVGLGAAGTTLPGFVGDHGLAPLDRREAGLPQTAFLPPGRASLARWPGFVARRQIRLLGASDHRVGKAICLADPERNGIEVHADRPVAAWRSTDGWLDVPSDPLDLSLEPHGDRTRLRDPWGIVFTPVSG